MHDVLIIKIIEPWIVRARSAKNSPEATKVLEGSFRDVSAGVFFTGQGCVLHSWRRGGLVSTEGAEHAMSVLKMAAVVGDFTRNNNCFSGRERNPVDSRTWMWIESNTWCCLESPHLRVRGIPTPHLYVPDAHVYVACKWKSSLKKRGRKKKLNRLREELSHNERPFTRD